MFAVPPQGNCFLEEKHFQLMQLPCQKVLA